jgi:hypothetical protein
MMKIIQTNRKGFNGTSDEGSDLNESYYEKEDDVDTEYHINMDEIKEANEDRWVET